MCFDLADTLNTQVHEATKNTPYELVFGQPPRSLLVPDVTFRGQLSEEVLITVPDDPVSYMYHPPNSFLPFLISTSTFCFIFQPTLDLVSSRDHSRSSTPLPPSSSVSSAPPLPSSTPPPPPPSNQDDQLTLDLDGSHVSDHVVSQDLFQGSDVSTVCYTTQKLFQHKIHYSLLFGRQINIISPL